MSVSASEIQVAATRFLARVAVWNELLFGDAASTVLMQVDPAPADETALDSVVARADAMASASLQQHGRHDFVERMGLLATFAWEGTWNSSAMHLTDAIHESLVVRNVLGHRYAFEHPEGSELFPDPDMAPLLAVQQAAHARWAILEGFDVRLTELAALADISDKTIRMAANPKNKDALVTHVIDKRTMVSADNALVWLRRRSSYRETRLFVAAAIRMDFSNAASVGRSLRQQRRAQRLALDGVARGAKLSAAEAKAYASLEQGDLRPESSLYGLPALLRLARVLGVEDVRSFVSGLSALALHAAADIEVDRRVGSIGGDA